MKQQLNTQETLDNCHTQLDEFYNKLYATPIKQAENNILTVFELASATKMDGESVNILTAPFFHVLAKVASTDPEYSKMDTQMPRIIERYASSVEMILRLIVITASLDNLLNHVGLRRLAFPVHVLTYTVTYEAGKNQVIKVPDLKLMFEAHKERSQKP